MRPVHGPDHARRFQRGFSQTHCYIHDMGGRIAPSKSYVFSTHKPTIQWLTQHLWPTVAANIATVLHARDLGAHLSVGRRGVGTTLTTRMTKAAIVTKGVRSLPTSYDYKAKLLRTKILAMGRFVGPSCAESALSALRSASVGALAPLSTLRAPTLVFEASSHGEDVDSTVQVLVRRCCMLRRMVAKHDGLLEQVDATHTFYARMQYVGTSQPDTELHALRLAPPHAHVVRSFRKGAFPALGPVGHLLHDIHCISAACDADFRILNCGEAPCPI